MNPVLIDLCYLLAAVLFIMGLKGLTRPRTAVRGNLTGALGMLIAVVVTMLHRDIVSVSGILVGIAIGSAVGVVLAQKIAMTAMPQLVALFNGLGGGASVLVAGAFLGGTKFQGQLATGACFADILTATAASGLIGAVTLSGSLVAFAKLQELKFVKDISFSGQKAVNAILALASVGLCVLLVMQPAHSQLWYWLMSLLATALGVLLVISIGGADMPVVV
ncbi:MAG: NAD(P)(+) transhydrogenase (Re/Si-specific) subunit beta, partial [Planctomycetaceae bacterium]|nr:NAD(P)(+) transhydrogenase (Re/Si-specific) subunit beta [Planctomycetaceae bacterium]